MGVDTPGLNKLFSKRKKVHFIFYTKKGIIRNKTPICIHNKV